MVPSPVSSVETQPRATTTDVWRVKVARWAIVTSRNTPVMSFRTRPTYVILERIITWVNIVIFIVLKNLSDHTAQLSQSVKISILLYGYHKMNMQTYSYSISNSIEMTLVGRPCHYVSCFSCYCVFCANLNIRIFTYPIWDVAVRVLVLARCYLPLWLTPRNRSHPSWWIVFA